MELRFKYYVSENIKKEDNGPEQILLKNVSDKFSLQEKKSIEKIFCKSKWDKTGIESCGSIKNKGGNVRYKLFLVMTK